MRPALPILAAMLACAGCEPPHVTVEETPIRIVDEGEGYGDPVRAGDTVRVDYRITLPEGRVVLDQRGYEFKVGTNSVIRGIDEAIVGMRPRGWRLVECPPHKHWGRAGYADGLVPPATNLMIDLKLAEVVTRDPRHGRDRRRGEAG